LLGFVHETDMGRITFRSEERDHPEIRRALNRGSNAKAQDDGRYRAERFKSTHVGQSLPSAGEVVEIVSSRATH
jgi:hypothetical protein